MSPSQGFWRRGTWCGHAWNQGRKGARERGRGETEGETRSSVTTEEGRKEGGKEGREGAKVEGMEDLRAAREGGGEEGE